MAMLCWFLFSVSPFRFQFVHFLFLDQNLDMMMYMGRVSSTPVPCIAAH